MGNRNTKTIRVGLWGSLFAVFFCLLVMVSMIIFDYTMASQKVYLRAWAELLGKGIASIGLVISIYACILFVLLYIGKNGRAKISKALLIVVSAVSTVVCGIAFLIVAVYMLANVIIFSDSGLEMKMDNGFLVSETGCYEEYTWLTKKAYVPTMERVIYTEEKKYNIEMTVASEDKEQSGFGTYTLTTVEEEPITFHVFPDNFLRFEDDYYQMRANRTMREKASEICPDRSLEDIKDLYTTNGIVTGILIHCNGRKDMEKCSLIVSALIAEVLKEPNYLNQNIKITVYCEGLDEIVARTSFYTMEENKDWETIYARLEENYSRYEVKNVTVTDDEINHEDSTEYVEGAYKVLYEELFAKEDYPYETSYNAKGNFYACLIEGTGTLESTEGTFETLETVVYDRVSKNNKCHMFVHYREYFRPNEQNSFTTGIVNMYAVDMETGEVYISDRHAWADLGTQEYRAATGEP